MKDILKFLWKWILWILIILLVGLAILTFRIFVIDKDYDGKASSKSDTVATSSSDSSGKSGSGSSSATDTVDSNGSSSGSLTQKVVNGAKSVGNSTVKGYKDDSEYDYNAYNFDETFLMFEGEDLYEGKVMNVLERLITNSEGNFYARTSVTAVNFGNDVSIVYDGDVQAYQDAIRTLESAVTSGKYDISFKYAGIMTYVNEIVITKK